MKLFKLMMSVIVVIGSMMMALALQPIMGSAAANSSVAIDGQFSDWSKATLTEGYNGYTALASSGNDVYVYVKMKNGAVPGYGDYNFTINGKQYYVWTNQMPSDRVSKGTTKAVTLTGGKYTDGTQYGVVGSGYVGSDGTHSLAEFKVDLSKMGIDGAADGKTVTMANPNIGNDSATTTVDHVTATSSSANTSSSAASSSAASSSTASSSTSGTISDKQNSSSKASTTTNPNANNDNDNLNIKIDGKFADWKNVTLTEGYNGYTAMVSDGNNVYVYVKMKYGMVPGYGDYNFDIGGKKVYAWSKDIPSSVSQGQAQAVSFKAGTYNDGEQYGTVGTGYVSNDGSHNIAEFKIDLTKLDVSTMTGQTITMYNPNIGNEKVTVAGGSTGPILISGIGVCIAGLGYLTWRKSGKLRGRHETPSK